jgi:uracil-DNA glycosylase family 4
MTCGKIDFACTRCGLSKRRTQVVPGTGPCSSPIVFIGEAPGREEDLKGEPFVGRGGKLLGKVLKEAGVDRSEIFICNLVMCRPPGNRRPRKDEIETCSQFLESELRTVRPKVVCALGQTVANRLLDNREKMAELVKKDRTVNIVGKDVRLFVAYHPAACLYQRKNIGSFRKSIEASLRAAKLVR